MKREWRGATKEAQKTTEDDVERCISGTCAGVVIRRASIEKTGVSRRDYVIGERSVSCLLPS